MGDKKGILKFRGMGLEPHLRPGRKQSPLLAYIPDPGPSRRSALTGSA